jgi:hypothetical protein
MCDNFGNHGVIERSDSVTFSDTSFNPNIRNLIVGGLRAFSEARDSTNLIVNLYKFKMNAPERYEFTKTELKEMYK